jgi:hypothetical protein
MVTRDVQACLRAGKQGGCKRDGETDLMQQSTHGIAVRKDQRGTRPRTHSCTRPFTSQLTSPFPPSLSLSSRPSFSLSPSLHLALLPPPPPATHTPLPPTPLPASLCRAQAPQAPRPSCVPLTRVFSSPPRPYPHTERSGGTRERQRETEREAERERERRPRASRTPGSRALGVKKVVHPP